MYVSVHRASCLAALGSVLALAGCAAAPPRIQNEGPAEIRRPAPTATPSPATAWVAPRTIGIVTMAAAGDLLIQNAVKDAAAAADRKDPDGRSLNHSGFGPLFVGVAAELSDADLAFANLESPIAEKPPRASVPYVFNAPAALVPALREAGLDVVSFANNHVYDQLTTGFAQTLDALDEGGLPYLGAGRSCEEAWRARLFSVNDMTIAFLGATTIHNERPQRKDGDPCSFLFDEAVALSEVAAARAAGADFVVLSIHWGVEYATTPRAQEIELAHRLLDGGVDVILGHHPHVLQPVEIYEARDGRITAVAYSLGNFISNQSRTYVFGVHPDRMGNPRDGAILRFAAAKRAYPSGVRTELANLSVEPLWTDNNALSMARDEKILPEIRVVSMTREAARVRAELAGETTPGRAAELERRLLLLDARRKIAGSILGEDLLRD